MRSLLVLTLVFTGCLNAVDTGDGADAGTDPGVGAGGGQGTPPPVDPPPPPIAPVYTRGSLKPIYGLLPRSEYGRMQIAGVTMADADFQSNATTTSAAQKIDEIAGQIGAADLIPDAADRQ